MLGIPLHDATGGYRAFRATTLGKIGLDAVGSRGYCFQVDLALRALRQGLRVVEVPITFVERVHGTSKMSQNIVAEAMWRGPRWGGPGPPPPGPRPRRGNAPRGPPVVHRVRAASPPAVAS